MAIGTVKFFNAVKGFGFIIPEDGGKDVFVHKTALVLAGIPTLSDGQFLWFETEPDPRGIVRAIKLKQHFKDNTQIIANEGPRTSSTNGSLGNRTKHGPRHAVRRDALSIVRNVDQTKLIGNSNASIKFKDWQRSYDRYCDLAQNASNDAVMREHYWQHAEHFRRMMDGSAT
jgi:CspA family cold shock protein